MPLLQNCQWSPSYLPSYISSSDTIYNSISYFYGKKHLPTDNKSSIKAAIKFLIYLGRSESALL